MYLSICLFSVRLPKNVFLFDLKFDDCEGELSNMGKIKKKNLKIDPFLSSPTETNHVTLHHH